MFDGSYRSRRAVNLSGKRSSKPRDKKALLEQSKLLREERRLATLRNDAATLIQRVYRGHTTRQSLIRLWSQNIMAIFRENNRRDQMDRVTTLLNALLGLLRMNPYYYHQNCTLLMEIMKAYAAYIESLPSYLPSQPRAHRVVWWILSSDSQHPMTSADGWKWPQKQQILSYAMDWPPSTPAHPKGYYWHRLGYDKGFQVLVDAYSRSISPKSSLHHGNNINDEESQQLQTFLFSLLQYTVPETVEGKALLSVMSLIENDTQVNTVPSILTVLRDTTSLSTNRTAATVHRLVMQNTDISLRNVIQYYHSRNNNSAMDIAAAVQMLRILLLDKKTDGESFMILLNRFVRGDDIVSTKLSAKVQNNGTDIGSDDSDDEDDNDDNRVHTTSAPVTKDYKSTYRMTKYELLTIPKLDRLFNNMVVQKIVQWHASTQHSNENDCQLASIITDPGLWLHWGEVLLSDESDNMEIQRAQDDFATLLTTLLQATTGLRPGQNASSSHLLSKLAFSMSFLEKLWKLVQRHHQEFQRNETSIMLHTSLTLFSDLFSHSLIATRDDQFLSNHTNTNVSDARSIILAENVILLMRPLMYQLYWAQPVVKTDFRLFLGNGEHRMTSASEISNLIVKSTEERVKAARARILITGTKLWNSLYERWCRLVRNFPFCSEDTWWFPTMTNLLSDNAVVRDGAIHSNAQSNDMEIDDDSSHSEMDEEEDHVHHSMRSEADADTDALAEAFSDPKMARILASIPQVLPFHRRVKLFDSLLKADKLKSQDEEGERHLRLLAMMRGEMDEFLHPRVEIRRDRLYEDSMLQLNDLGSKLKQKVQVTFINQHGAQEAGIDGGGVFREFIDDLIRDSFSVERKTAGHRLFAATPLETLKVNTDLEQDPSLLTHYEFLGRVLGKAVYESILVEPQFCLPFLNQLLGKSNSIEDLKNFDPEYYKNLTKLLTLTEDELDSMGLTFELNIGTGSAARSVELIPGGRDLHVTKQNVIQYIHLVSHQRLNVQSAHQTRAFLRGFRDLIPASWVRLFSADELQKLISGDDSVKGIDVSSLKQVMQYAAGYHPSQAVIQWFWEIVEEMNSEQQHKLLKFMTSCSRQPLLGFGSLEPSPCVQQIRLPDETFATNDEEKIEKATPLPTSSTCMNLLKLPNYRSKELMRKKLLAAIESGAGFELT